MPKKTKKTKAAAAASTPQKKMEVVVKVSKPQRTKANWTESLFNPYLGPMKLPDMASAPSAVAQSQHTGYVAAFVSTTSYGRVLAFQIFPRGGPNQFYRTIASAVGDVLTWGAWQAAPNATAMTASSSNFRVTAGCLLAAMGGNTLANQQGTLYAMVGPSCMIGSTTTNNVSDLTTQPRLVCVTDPLKVVKAVCGFNCYTDFDYLTTSSASIGDTDADVLTVFSTFGGANTSLTISACVNWECIVSNRTTTVLPVTPAYISSSEMERGMRALSLSGQTFVLDNFPVNAGALPIVGTPAAEMERVESAVSNGPFTVTDGYLDQAVDASRSLRTIVENGAASATALGLGYMATRTLQRR